MAKSEQLGFRDERLSAFHRSLGDDCPAVDLDFVLCEYESRRPKALIDYKHENARKVSKQSASFDALRELCAPRSRGVPLFVCRYSEDLEQFNVYPLNPHAYSFVPSWHEVMSRDRFIRFQERLRKKGG